MPDHDDSIPPRVRRVFFNASQSFQVFRHTFLQQLSERDREGFLALGKVLYSWALELSPDAEPARLSQVIRPVVDDLRYLCRHLRPLHGWGERLDGLAGRMQEAAGLSGGLETTARAGEHVFRSTYLRSWLTRRDRGGFLDFGDVIYGWMPKPGGETPHLFGRPLLDDLEYLVAYLEHERWSYDLAAPSAVRNSLLALIPGWLAELEEIVAGMEAFFSSN